MKRLQKITTAVLLGLSCLFSPAFGMQPAKQSKSWIEWFQALFGQETEQTKEDKKIELREFLNNGDHGNAFALIAKSTNPSFMSELVIQYVPALAHTHYGKKIIFYLLNADQSCHVQFAAKVAECITQFPTNFLVEIAQKITDASAIDNAIVALANFGKASDLFKALEYEMHLRKNLEFSLTPTGVHLRKNIWALQDKLINTYKNEPELLDLFDDIIAKERAMNNAGYYTFLHAQRRAFYLSEKVYTALWEVKHNKPTQDFLFAHVKELYTTEAQKVEEYCARKFLIAHGRIPKDNYTRQKLLFLNYALFANMRDLGSNSAYYLANNINWGSVPIRVAVDDAFKLLGYESLYEKFKDELEALNAEYQKGKFGNMLLACVPRKTASKYVYLCEAGKGLTGRGGIRRHIDIKGIGTTDNINIIMRTLLHNPERIANSDDLEFALVMTASKGGLDPDTGIKMIPLVSGNKELLRQLQQKEEDLIARIKVAAKEFEDKVIALTNAQIRAAMIARHIVQ